MLPAIKNIDESKGIVRGRSCPNSRLLYQPSDRESLSELLCLVRSQIEVFIATEEDAEFCVLRGGRRDVVVKPGQVGIRCRWCRDLPRKTRGAISLPKSVRLVYQSVRNFQRFHLLSCPAVPEDVKSAFLSVKSKRSSQQGRSKNKSVSYWEEHCRSMGMVDTAQGIMLREGFTLEDVLPIEEGEGVTQSENDDACVLPQGWAFNDVHDAEEGNKEDGIAQSENDNAFATCLFTDIHEAKKGNEEEGVAQSQTDDAFALCPFDDFHEAKEGSREEGVSQSENDNLLSSCPLEPAAVAAGVRQGGSSFEGEPAMMLPSANEGVAQCQTDDVFALCPFDDFREAKEGSREEGVGQSENDNVLAPCPLEPAAVSAGVRQGGSSFEGELARTLPSENEVLWDDSSVQGLAGYEESTKAGTTSPTSCSSAPTSPETDKCAVDHLQLGTEQTEELLKDPFCHDVHSVVGILGASRPTSPSSSLLKIAPEVVMEQVGMAYEIVRTIGEMRPLPTSDLVGFDVQQKQPQEDEKEDMTAVGVDLYKLFSGQHPLGSCDNLGLEWGEEGSIDNTHDAPDAAGGTNCVSNINNAGDKGPAGLGLGGSEESDGGDRGGQQHKRRGTFKRVMVSDAVSQRGGMGRYVPLSVLGLPPSLCSLVSSLLNGDGFYSTVYKVQEALDAMRKDPDRFLFDSSTGMLELPKDALFGRREEMQLLLDAYDRAVSANRPAAGGGEDSGEGGGSVEVVMISGYSGTGKSSIVRAARPQFVSLGAHFVSGKFDAMRHIRPLSAIISALDEYCDLLAGMDASGLAIIRESIGYAVGGEVQALVDLIPNLRKIVDVLDEPSVPQGGREAQQRLMFLFRVLLRVTCSPVHPIVLFLDDLQWADEASLQLLHVLVTDIQVRGLLFVGCYRDNEISGPDHPLMSHLEDLRRMGNIAITSIRVGNLDGDYTNALVSHSLRMVPPATRSLSDEVLHKTGGNALFAVQLLVSLVDSGLLRFSLSRRQWEWDLNGIRARDIADNVVELMMEKMLRLSHEMQEALRVLAGFGAQCQDELLQILDRGDGIFPKCVGSGKVGYAGLLSAAITEGLIAEVGTAYRFSHDQIQQAAYLLTPEAERATFHLRLGRCLWKWSTPEEMDQYLFVVIDQLHRGVDLIVDREEKVELAQLCLRAGQKASTMSSFLPASVYFKAGITLLVDEDWTANHDLCLDLYNFCAETEFILADFPAMQEHLEQVFVRARSLQERLRAYHTLVHSIGSQGHSSDAISTCIKVLELLGVDFPLVPSMESVKQDMAMTMKLLENMTVPSLLHLETMQDTEKKEAMRILDVMYIYAFVDKPRQYFPLVVNRMVRLTLLHGVCRQSITAFGCYGAVMCATGDIRTGYQFGKLAMDLLERFQAKEVHAKLYTAVYGYINGWIEPIHSFLPIYKQAVSVGLATGDTVFAMCNAILYLSRALNTGQPLGPLLEEMESYSKQMIEYRQVHVHQRTNVLKQAVLYLIDESAYPAELFEVDMNLEDLLSNLEEKERKQSSPFSDTMAYFYRMWLAYLFGRYDVAAGLAERNKDVENKSRPCFVTSVNHKFFEGLTAMELGRKTGESKWREIAEACIEQIKVWAEFSEWNFQHKLELLNAEYAYLRGDFAGAAKAYDSAVKLSTKHRFIHEQALAWERAGIFSLERSDRSVAIEMFTKSHECYRQWGAFRKAKHLQEHYL